LEGGHVLSTTALAANHVNSNEKRYKFKNLIQRHNSTTPQVKPDDEVKEEGTTNKNANSRAPSLST
jgi:hypothetical protein